MVIFPILIMASIVLYVYYKVAILRSKDELTQVYMNAKSRVCLGSFVSLFGINQYLFYQTRVSLFIGFIFVFLGALQIVHGYREAVHYRKELRKLSS